MDREEARKIAREAYQTGYNDALRACATVAKAQAGLNNNPGKVWMAEALAEAFEKTAENGFADEEAARRQAQNERN